MLFVSRMATWGEYLRSFVYTPVPPKRDFDRNFIMLGKVNSGKSTLSNLLLGCKDKIHFPRHEQKASYGFTTEVSSRETEVATSIVFGDEYTGSNTLKIQITDLPGTNDDNFKDKKSCKHVLQSIKESRAELSDTFLIVCDISGKFFTNEEIISILNISEILSHSGYMFFQNAILVFTHKDLVDNPEEKLIEILQTDKWAGIGKLLESIENRHLFINSLDQTDKNRNFLIKTLFDLSKPTLNVAITGNNGFQSSELRDILKLHDSTLVQRKSERFNVEYFFNPSLDIFHRFDKLTIEQRLEDELKKMFIISKGISVMVILISLEDSFTEEFYSLINQIPETFSIQKSGKVEDDPLWKYSFVLFLSPKDDKSLVERNIKRNLLLKEIVLRVDNRFTWVTRDMQPDECYRRLIKMVLRVNHDSQGTSFINNTIVSEISSIIDASSSTKDLQRANENVLERSIIQKNIPCFEEKGSTTSWIRANTFNWNKEEISHILAFFLVKRVKPESTDEFLAMYPNTEKPIPKEDFKNFCLQHLK